MLLACKAVFAALLFTSVTGRNDDLFNYGSDTQTEGGRESFGQPDWMDVTCSDIEECSGYPEKYPHASFSIADANNCKWCPDSGSHSTCGLHRQSPIGLKREIGVETGPEYKDCPDWHYMQTRDDSCTFDDIKGNFAIARHALQINIPQLDDGDIDCMEDGRRLYPRVDYSKGFPNWWLMQRVDVMVPSQHTQEGNQYAAEVVLAHYYEIDFEKNQLGHISIFLQDYEDAESWGFLDKMICQWRIEEEKVRSACSQAPASPYGRCELFRNQDPTAEWLAEEAGEIFTEENPTAPTTNETEAPYLEFYNVTEEPTEPPVAAPVESPSEPTSPTPFEFYNTTDVPIEAPVDAPVESPSETPYPIPPVDAPVESPSEPGSPSPAPIESTVTGAPPDIKCGDYTINFSRMCKSDDPCCGEKRSDTEFCWDSYDELGDAVQSACYHCCETPMFVGAAAPEKDNLPKTIQCSTVENPHRICKADSCCSNPRSESEHCVQQYALYTDDEFEQICHYCCTEPQDLGPSTTRRYLRSDEERAIDDSSLAGDMPVPVGAKVYNVHGRKYLVRQENFEPIEESEQEYFDKVYASHKRRSLATVHSENYEDIEWYPYEWLVKVGTEYYYRYEGAMMVPPCFETVHWRNMKDPVKVNKRQIDELNRLLAWRLDPDTCEKNTAGIVSDDGNRVNLNRDLQYTHKQHRAVFCECKDWPSKFEGDRAWCEDWKEDTNHDRFYTNMYNFDSGGQWLPTTAQ